jgi:Xaa-Pro aminopeptidase
MFDAETYIARRNVLKQTLGSGIAVFFGNKESAMNYPANTFPFRQDSTFLYYLGLDFPDLAAVIDFDNDQEIIFGNDFTVDDIIWMGPQESLAQKALRAGIQQTQPFQKLEKLINKAQAANRRIHFLPQYRPENALLIETLLGIKCAQVNSLASRELIRAVVSQRSQKSDAEVQQIEQALAISARMYAHAMATTRPGMYEYVVSGVIEALVRAQNSHPSFPLIFTTHGEVLHGHAHDNLMREGAVVVMDSGAESPLHYASDITRTFPVSGRFTTLQKDIYSIVYSAHAEAVALMKPGILYRDVHLHAAATITAGMKSLGFMKGDTHEAAAAGAHALFFPHGLGHLLGLDVHDMESLGEDYVGYDERVQRSALFGLAYLRFAKELKPGHVLTVEPGIYFIPALIAQWKSRNALAAFINYEKVQQYMDFGGIRIEDDVYITEHGSRILGTPISRSIQEIEESCAR